MSEKTDISNSPRPRNNVGKLRRNLKIYFGKLVKMLKNAIVEVPQQNDGQDSAVQPAQPAQPPTVQPVPVKPTTPDTENPPDNQPQPIPTQGTQSPTTPQAPVTTTPESPAVTDNRNDQIVKANQGNQAFGSAFMSGFNELYYTFSPTIADMERESPMFKEAVKLGLTPMLSTLTIMESAETESEVLGLGLSVIALNLGMYIAAPAMMFYGISKKVKSVKLS